MLRFASFPAASLLALVAALAAPAPLAGAEAIECRVVSRTADGVHVDAGRDDGLEEGWEGTVDLVGAETARVEVVAAARRSALLRIVAGRDGEIRPGSRVLLRPPAGAVPREGAGGVTPATGDRPSPTVRGPSESEEEFVPLLAPLTPPGTPEPANIARGRLRARGMFQTDREGSLDFIQTRLGSDGGVDRIGGTPWAVDWSGDFTLRSGDAWSGTGLDEPDLEFYRLSLYRRYDGGGFLRAGRFLPPELPGVGYVDGVHREIVLTPNFRLGGIAGLKPDRRDLDPSAKEPMAVAYGTAEGGKRGELYAAGTLGILGSMYEGKYDRLAFLLDGRADLGSKLSIFSTSEIDVDAGAAEYRSGVRLTRTDLYAASPVASFLTLRAGLDHFERPDTRAERDLMPFDDARFFDGGYWRYWVGATEYLPWKIRLDEELALIDASGENLTPRWRVAATRTGLPGFAAGQVTVTVYNLDGADAEGYGGSLSAFFPFLDGRLSVRPAAGFRFLETDATSESFEMTDLSLHADWWISKAWSAYAGVTGTFGDDIDRILIDIGVDFRW